MRSLQEEAAAEKSLREAGNNPSVTDIWDAAKLRTKAGQGCRQSIEKLESLLTRRI